MTDIDPPLPLERPHLVDTTVWSKVRPHDRLADWFNQQVRAHRVVVCDLIVLELLKTAQSARDFDRQAIQLGVLPTLAMGTAVHTRAREVQRRLARTGHHRGVPPADLLIAATAEIDAVPLLHYDHDYDLIARVTDQEAQWVLPAGALP